LTRDEPTQVCSFLYKLVIVIEIFIMKISN
jgi:hypothetical protein